MTLDDSGKVVTTDDYYPFGLLEHSGNPGSSGQMPGRSFNIAMSSNIYKYSSKELDEESGLQWYYFGARYYDPGIGKFLTIDRFTDMYPDITPYQYAKNNPILYIDVNGDSTKRRNDDDIPYEETEAIEVTAERYSPSWWNPLTYASFLLFGNRNYHEALFNKEAGMAALASFSIAFVPGGGGSKGVTNGIKTLAIGFAKGTGKSILNPKRLQHAARHLIKAKLIPNWSNATKGQFEKLVVGIVENPKRTFDYIMKGGTPAKGFVGNVGGREVIVYVAKEGGQVAAGDLITVVPK